MEKGPAAETYGEKLERLVNSARLNPDGIELLRLISEVTLKDRNAADSERLAQIQQFEILAKCLEDGDITSVLEWLRAAVKLLEKQTG